MSRGVDQNLKSATTEKLTNFGNWRIEKETPKPVRRARLAQHVKSPEAFCSRVMEARCQRRVGDPIALDLQVKDAKKA